MMNSLKFHNMHQKVTTLPCSGKKREKGIFRCSCRYTQESVSICTRKKKKPSVMDFLKNKKINKDESPPSSNHFQCDLVSFQLQTGQIKCPPAALPGDLSLTHQTPFHWPLLTKNMLSDAQTGFLAWSVEGQWWGEEVWDTGKEETKQGHQQVRFLFTRDGH